MDLDDFEGAATDEANVPLAPILSASAALKALDHIWYSTRSKTARWMDLLGDYAGSETFVLDGDALVQHILDDPLLALGHENEITFQSLHAILLLERFIKDFLDRRAIFEIVFWEANRHLTIRTGSNVSAARCLARTMLARHLVTKLAAHVKVHCFADLDDPAWIEYVLTTRPMFVMTHDGGPRASASDDWSASGALSQRTFLFTLITNGMAVAHLQGLEFLDLKILTFIIEGRRDPEIQNKISASIWLAAESAARRMDALSAAHPTLGEVRVETPGNLDSLLAKFGIEFLQQQTEPASAVSLELLHAFIAHCVVLDGHISLQDRGASNARTVLDAALHRVLFDSFLPRVYCALSKVLPNVNIVPDIDGRVFVRLLAELCDSGAGGLNSILNGVILERLQSIWVELEVAAPMEQLHHAFSLADVLSSEWPAPPHVALLPFDNSIISPELLAVNITTPVSVNVPLQSLAVRFSPGTVYRDTHHWHNQKSILPTHQGGEKTQQLTNWERMKVLKREQKNMARFQRFAESLRGAMGASLEQQIIPSVPTRQPVKGKATVRAQPPKAQNTKSKPLTSKEKLLQKIQDDKSSKTLTDTQAWWDARLAELSALSTVKQVALAETLATNKRVSAREAEPWLALEFAMYVLHLELRRWIAQPESARTAMRDVMTVRIMRGAVAAYARSGHSAATHATLGTVLVSLGFGAYEPQLRGSALTADRPLSFAFEKLLSRKSGTPLHSWMRIEDRDPVVWQLRVFGEFLDRSMDGAPDPRVTFEPDGWQREVLDSLDRNESILVVAPTSAGKTFISFYAMEKVLRAADDSVLVYVAPTKALVNQIAADVYARFSKSRESGKSFWAIHTRDNRVNDPQGCQILVTVPEMLAIMLLSPELAKVWTPRIKRIILDEIHSIGQLESGHVWEQILLLAPCPIIGLSATVGEPEGFNTWLASVQKAHGFAHTFIRHPHRYSHLRKHIYLTRGQQADKFVGLADHVPTNRMRFLHPLTMLGLGNVAPPPDFAMEAADTNALYTALAEARAALPAHLTAEIDKLDPVVFFARLGASFLKQKDILRYEAALMHVVRELLHDRAASDPSGALQTITRSLTDPVVARAGPLLNLQPSKKAFLSGLIHLVADLHVAGDLPGILFSFDRSHCEILAQRLTEELEDAERAWRKRSPEWQQRVKQWELWKSQAPARAKSQARMQKVKRDPDAPQSGAAVVDTSWEASFDPEQPTEHFSFAGNSSTFSRAELEENIYELEHWSGTPHWALTALRRGIAVHHAGMNKKYRSLIESLFRMRFVRVVISTGTLALGINAPAKTTVFCGDSVFLTALMYRQCAGRAGRRGFDLLGKVVFYGLPMDRIQRIVTSRLPALTGSFPLSPTMILRLANLLDGSDQAPSAVNAVQSILRLPQIAYGSPIGRDQLLHHVRFSLDYLRRSFLLDEAGRPLNLFAITSRLYYTAPGNLALVALLQSGVIHDICSQTSRESAKHDFVLVMCHLFGRRYLPAVYTVPPKSASMVVLPPLPEPARQVLLRHSNTILHVFAGYAHAFAAQFKGDLDHANSLPLSRTTYSSHVPPSSCPPFVQRLRRDGQSCTIRNPFVATSGHSDHFSSVQELTCTARDGLNLSSQAIPTLEHITGNAALRTSDGITPRSRASHVLNAYLLDFFIHGQVATLARDNGVRRGDVWYTLDDFSMTLKTVQAAIQEMLTADKKTSDESEASAEAFPDSGYASADVDGFASDDEGHPAALREKPAAMLSADWKVLDVVTQVQTEFESKFRNMWAR